MKIILYNIIGWPGLILWWAFPFYLVLKGMSVIKGALLGWILFILYCFVMVLLTPDELKYAENGPDWIQSMGMAIIVGFIPSLIFSALASGIRKSWISWRNRRHKFNES